MATTPSQKNLKTKPQSALFRLKTHPAIQSTLHKSRRRLGQYETAKLEKGRFPAEQAVIDAVTLALRTTTPTDPWVDRIEHTRAEYLASSRRLTDVDRGKTTTLAGAASVSRSPRGALLLYFILNALLKETVEDEWHAVECGTCVGISGAYLAAALAQHQKGHLVTLELWEDLARQARETFESTGVSDQVDIVVGNIDDTLDDVLGRIAWVNFAFIDGNHQLAPTMAYAEQILQKSGSGAVLVFDDIDWSAGMQEAWRAICNDPRFSLLLNLGSMGIAVVGQQQVQKRIHRIHYA